MKRRTVSLWRRVLLRLACLSLLALVGCPPVDGEAPVPTLPQRAVEWERLQPGPLDSMWRTRVPGGWLVAADDLSRPTTVYVPDPEHAWLAPAVEAGR